MKSGPGAINVSVAMAVYQGRAHLREQVDSILGQDTGLPIELVAVDDGSSDGSFELLTEIAGKDPRVRVYRNDVRLGLVGNFLKAVSLTGGDRVCYSDQDDVWMPEKLSVLSGLMDRDPSTRLVYSDLEVCDESLRPLHDSFWKLTGSRPRRGSLGTMPILRNLSPGCSMMFDARVRDLLKAVWADPSFAVMNASERLDDQTFFHDHLALVVACALGRVDFTRRRLVRYRQHASNSVGAFYQPLTGPGRLTATLERKIKLIERVAPLREVLDVAALKELLDCLRGGHLPQRLARLPHYLYLRDDRPTQRAMGVLQCLLPGLYERARGWARS